MNFQENLLGGLDCDGGGAESRKQSFATVRDWLATQFRGNARPLLSLPNLQGVDYKKILLKRVSGTSLRRDVLLRKKGGGLSVKALLVPES